MERMLRMNKDNSEYEIDREITGKLAIESNAELQDRVEGLEEENKKLKDKIAHLEFDIEAWRQLKSVMEGGIEELVEDYKALGILNDEIRRVNENLREENKKLNEKVRFLEECLDDKEKVNKSLREELSKKSMETWFDKKAKNIFIDNSGKVIKGGEFTTLC